MEVTPLQKSNIYHGYGLITLQLNNKQFFERLKMAKQNKKLRDSQDDQYEPGCQGKRGYKRVSQAKLKKFLKLTLEQKVKTNKASKKLRINYSNAKVIVRKEKVIRQSIKTESSLAQIVEEVKIQDSQNSLIRSKKPEYPIQNIDIKPIWIPFFITPAAQFFPIVYQKDHQ